jgi:hypothetical protein
MRILDAHCNLGQGYGCSQSADELLRQMDANGVEKAVIVPADRHTAVTNSEGNDEMLAAARSHPDRFIAFCTASPWYGPKAIDEIRRVFDAGAKGLKLHPVLQGFTITDDVARPLIEAAVERGRPIYFHTGTPVCSTPFQLAEVAMRYPEGKFIMGHLAYADYWNDVESACQAAPNIWLETSAHLASVIRLWTGQAGAHRVMYGSDSPHNDMPVEIEKITRYITDDATKAMIFAGTLERLLEAD